jgi:cell division protein FtsL
MATWASLVDRFVGVRALELERVEPVVWPRTDSPKLRPLANEDVYFFVKHIDNSGVIRAVDPAARRACSRSAITGFLAAMLIIVGLLPAAYNTMSGFTLERLRQEQQALKQQEAVLNLEEAQLLSPARLEKLAVELKMVDPAPQQVQEISAMAPNSEARNRVPESLSQ